MLIFLVLLAVWPKGGAVALAAFREGVRQPMFWLIFGIGFAALTIAPFWPYFTFGEDHIMVKDLGLDTVMLAAVFFGALLPIPFKVVALSAGFCQVPFLPFIACVLAARLLRFFLVAGAMYRFGQQVNVFIEKHFNHIVLAVGAKLALTAVFFWALGQ